MPHHILWFVVLPFKIVVSCLVCFFHGWFLVFNQVFFLSCLPVTVIQVNDSQLFSFLLIILSIYASAIQFTPSDYLLCHPKGWFSLVCLRSVDTKKNWTFNNQSKCSHRLRQVCVSHPSLRATMRALCRSSISSPLTRQCHGKKQTGNRSGFQNKALSIFVFYLRPRPPDNAL